MAMRLQIAMYRHVLSHRNYFFQSVQRSIHNLSYVEWARKLQALKNNNIECSMCIPDGRFLLYSNQRPLLETYKAQGEDYIADEVSFLKPLQTELIAPQSSLHNRPHPPLQIAWLTYPEVRELCLDIFVSNVLVTLSPTGVPIYAVQVEKLDTEQKSSLSSEASFQDLRVALFTVSAAHSALLTAAYSMLSFHDTAAYCSKCGNKTKRNASGSHRSCASCKTNIYPNSRPTAIMMVTDRTNTRALLVRQNRLPRNMFTCISGFAEAGETIEECVRREVAEESGVELQDVTYLGSQYWPFPGSLMAGCIATAATDEVIIDNDEIESGRWFSRDDVAEAVNTSRNDPLPWVNREGQEDGSTFKLVVPPPLTIANCLMTHWINTKS